VFGIGPATRIYLAVGATDMRKGFNGLHGLVRDRLQPEPRSDHLFYSATNRGIGLKYYSGMATDFGFARNGWSGVASAGRKRRLEPTESGSPTRT
jgi:hypothetical protein